MANALHLNPPETFNLNASDPASKWNLWLSAFEIYEVASGIDGKADKVGCATLLHCIGANVQRIFVTLPGDKGSYEEAKTVLKAHFEPKKNVIAERYKYRQRAQGPNESIDQYITALRDLIRTCDYNAMENELLRDQIVEKCKNNNLRVKLLGQDNLTLDKALQMARTHETAHSEAKAMTGNLNTSITTENTLRVDYKGKSKPFKSGTTGTECFRCGLGDHAPDTCGALTAECAYCHIKGHYARKCRKKMHNEKDKSHDARPKQGKQDYKKPGKKRGTVRNVVESESESDTEFVWNVKSDGNKCARTVKINGQKLNMIVDTGSERNIIGSRAYNGLFRRYLLRWDPTLDINIFICGPNLKSFGGIGAGWIQLISYNDHHYLLPW
jgi:hypothetical protein